MTSSRATRCIRATRSWSTATRPARASITGSRRSSLVLLALVRPGAVPPEPVLPDRPVRRRADDARDPSLDRRGAVLRLLRPVPPLLAGQSAGSATDSAWLARIRDVLTGHEEKLPEVGKYNAGQKIVFWSMSLLIIVLITSGVVIWDQYFFAVHHDRAEARRRARPCVAAVVIDLRLDRPRLCGDLGARHDQRHDARHGHRRLGVAASPQVAAGAGQRQDASQHGIDACRIGELRFDCHVARAVREVSNERRSACRGMIPIPIGEVATPPFVRLPDPATLFGTRAQRFRALARDHELAALSALPRRPRRGPAPHPGRPAGA